MLDFSFTLDRWRAVRAKLPVPSAARKTSEGLSNSTLARASPSRQVATARRASSYPEHLLLSVLQPADLSKPTSSTQVSFYILRNIQTRADRYPMCLRVGGATAGSGPSASPLAAPSYLLLTSPQAAARPARGPLGQSTLVFPDGMEPQKPGVVRLRARAGRAAAGMPQASIPGRRMGTTAPGARKVATTRRGCKNNT